MRSILTAILAIISFQAYSQVSVSDSLSTERFQVRNGAIRGTYPKASAYVDVNTSGLVAIRQLGSDRIIVNYQAANLYVINGANTAILDSAVSWLGNVIGLEYCCSGDGGGCLESCTLAADVDINANGKYVDFNGGDHQMSFNKLFDIGIGQIVLDGFHSQSSDGTVNSYVGSSKTVGIDSMFLPGELTIAGDPFMGSGSLLLTKTLVDTAVGKSFIITDGTKGFEMLLGTDGIKINPEQVLSAPMAYDILHINNSADNKEVKLRSDGSITHNGAYANTSYVISGTPGGFTIPDNVSYALYDPASIQVSATIVMPENPFDGQVVTIAFGGNIITGTVVTSLLISPNMAQTLLIGSIGSTGTVEQPFSFIWMNQIATWALISK